MQLIFSTAELSRADPSRLGQTRHIKKGPGLLPCAIARLRRPRQLPGDAALIRLRNCHPPLAVYADIY